MRNRSLHALLIACAFAGAMWLSTSSSAQSTARLDLPAQPLDAALRALGKQTRTNILFDPVSVKDRAAPAISGAIDLEEALGRMLTGSGLTWRFIDAHTVTLIPADTTVARKTSLAMPEPKTADPIHLAQGRSDEGGSDAQAAQPARSPGPGAPAQGAEDDEQGRPVIEQVIVTASKRAERVQDFASSITAVSAEDIAHRGLVGMEDYLRGVPGVNNVDRGVASNSIVIRGVTADAQNYTDMGGTVGLYLGDVPLSGYATFGNNVDIKLIDMERVEVLRGPQGTLYGDGSLGGTVRNIPRAPKLDRFEAQIKAGYSHTGRLGGDNNQVQAVINVPVAEGKFALRAVGYRYDNSGYVDNIAKSDPTFSARATSKGFANLLLDQNDIGNSEYTGGRLTGLWQPTEKLRASLMLLRQNLSQNGLPEVQLNLGPYQQTRLQIDSRYGGGSERIRDNLSIANLELDYDFDWATLHSSTSHIDEDGLYLRDIGSFFGGDPFPQHVVTDARAFVEELRLTSQLEGRFKYLAGLYYNDSLKKRFSESHRQTSPTTALPSDGRDREYGAKQKAAFGELSYRLLSQLKATVGLRAFDYDHVFTTLNYLTPTPTFSRLESHNRKGTTHKFNLSYTPAEDALIYAQYSEGFRLGTPIAGPPQTSCDIDNDGLIDGTNLSSGDRQLDPDSLESYEVGAKFTLASGRGTVSAAVYRNDWTGIPVVMLVPCGFGQFVNAGEAQTEGVEFESSWALYKGLHASLSASYVDAALSKDSPGIGFKGNRLPGSPRYNVNVGIQNDFELRGLPAFVRADVLKVGGFYNNLASTGVLMGDYTTVNLRGGITFGQMSLEGYVNNATNTDKLTWVDSVFVRADARASRLLPRTLGLLLGYQF